MISRRAPRTSRRPAPWRAAGLLTVPAVMLLAACGGSDDGAAGEALDTVAETAPATEPATTESAVTEAPAVTEPATTEAPVATEPAATEAPAASSGDATEPVATGGSTTDGSGDGSSAAETGGGECLIGDWIVSNEEMNAYYSVLGVNAAPEGIGELEIDVPTGEVQLSFAPDTYVYTADFEISVSVAGLGGDGTAAGTVTGDWSAAGGTIVAEETSSDLEVLITVGETTVDAGMMAEGLLDSAPIQDAEFDCAGPTIDFVAGPNGERHTVTLTAA